MFRKFIEKLKKKNAVEINDDPDILEILQTQSLEEDFEVVCSKKRVAYKSLRKKTRKSEKERKKHSDTKTARKKFKQQLIDSEYALSESVVNSSDHGWQDTSNEKIPTGSPRKLSAGNSKHVHIFSQGHDEDELAIEIEDFDKLFLRELISSSSDEPQKEKHNSKKIKKKMKTPKKNFSRSRSRSVERERRVRKPFSPNNYLTQDSGTYLERKAMIYEKFRINRKDDVPNRPLLLEKESLEDVSRKRQEVSRQREIVRKQREYIHQLKREQERLRIRVRRLAFHKPMELRDNRAKPPYWSNRQSPQRSILSTNYSRRHLSYEIDKEEAYRRRVDRFLRKTTMGSIKSSPLFRYQRSDETRDKIKRSRNSAERENSRSSDHRGRGRDIFSPRKSSYIAEDTNRHQSRSSSYPKRSAPERPADDSSRKRQRLDNYYSDRGSGKGAAISSYGSGQSVERAWENRSISNSGDRLRNTTASTWDYRSDRKGFSSWKGNVQSRDRWLEKKGRGRQETWSSTKYSGSSIYPATTTSNESGSFSPRYSSSNSTNKYETFKNGKY